MYERFPNVCLVMFWVLGLFVMYQSPEPIEAFPPWIVSHTLVVAAMRCPQPPGTPAGGQSSPPGIPPWKRSYGRMNDCVSPPQFPRTLGQLAPPTVQLVTQRLTPPLVLPWK